MLQFSSLLDFFGIDPSDSRILEIIVPIIFLFILFLYFFLLYLYIYPGKRKSEKVAKEIFSKIFGEKHLETCYGLLSSKVVSKYEGYRIAIATSYMSYFFSYLIFYFIPTRYNSPKTEVELNHKLVSGLKINITNKSFESKLSGLITKEISLGDPELESKFKVTSENEEITRKIIDSKARSYLKGLYGEVEVTEDKIIYREYRQITDEDYLKKILYAMIAVFRNI